ncbi:MAG: hypothetical protein ACI8TX_003112 [Hyphomicrobiaceae bacterium]
MAVESNLSPMAKVSEAILRHPEHRTGAWTAIVLMLSMVGMFVLFALYLDHDHVFADRLAAALPSPGVGNSLAADPTLAAQVRVDDLTARITMLEDQTTAMIAEARVTNDALIDIQHVVMEASVVTEGRERSVLARCGHAVSDRLLKRMPRSEVTALMRITPSDPAVLGSGESTRCQVAIANVREGIDKVTVRIASAEPIPGHPDPLFLPPSIHRRPPTE